MNAIFILDQRWPDDDFLFVVGLEVRREIRSGELMKFAARLPYFAAIGGMIFRIIFLALNMGGPPRPVGPFDGHGHRLAVGALALLRKRCADASHSAVSLAVIDDIGAILVIAIFIPMIFRSRALEFSGLAP